jgi:hypothetical protein
MRDREKCLQLGPGDQRAKDDAALEHRLFSDFLTSVTDDWQWDDDEPFRTLCIENAKFDTVLLAPAVLLAYAVAAEQGRCYQGLNGRENRVTSAIRCAIMLIEKMPFTVRARALQQQLPLNGESFHGKSAVTAVSVALAIKDPRAVSHFLGSEHVQAVLMEWWFEPSALATSSRRLNDMSTAAVYGVAKTFYTLGGFDFRPAKVSICFDYFTES